MMPLRSTFFAAAMTSARSLLATFSVARMPAGAVTQGLGAGEGENDGAGEGDTEVDGVGSAVGVAFEQAARTNPAAITITERFTGRIVCFTRLAGNGLRAGGQGFEPWRDSRP